MEKLNGTNPLIGLFFITFENKEQHRIPTFLGEIIGQISENKYLIQLFEWGTLNLLEKKMFNIDDMFDWSFYDEDQWRSLGKTY